MMYHISFGYVAYSGQHEFIVKAESKEKAMDKIEAYLRQTYAKRDADKLVKLMRHVRKPHARKIVFGAHVEAVYDDEEVIDVSFWE